MPDPVPRAAQDHWRDVEGILLFGLTVTRISNLIYNDINRPGDDAYLTVSRSPGGDGGEEFLSVG